MDAFRLMQQSGHIGKIVMTPPAPGTVHRSDETTRKFVVDPARAHMITGGFGGFGLETAKWLARKGAKHLSSWAGAARRTRMRMRPWPN